MSKEISNEDLLNYIDNSIAKAISSVANAGAVGVSANAGSGQAGAGAGTANARTQSNKESDASTQSDMAQVYKNIDSDIGVNEAWSANVKRTYDVHQSYDLEGQVENRTHFNNTITMLQTHLANVNQLTLQSLANNQNQSNLNNTLSIDRSWNVNETDGFAVLLQKVVGEAVQKAVSDSKK